MASCNNAADVRPAIDRANFDESVALNEDFYQYATGCTPDGKYSLTACRCIGACGLAPVLTVNEDVYGKITAADIKGILAKYQD